MTNKEIVLRFYDEVFNKWDVSNLNEYMREDYIQHNPTAPNGRDGFVEFTKFFFTLEPHMDIVRIGEDGDMVYVFFKCTVKGGNVNKVCDIYRLEDGKLAEHWDVIEHSVQDVEPVNGNSIF
jgi:predicted SnoaL-like aldol condensation-catalyzing enzyme